VKETINFDEPLDLTKIPLETRLKWVTAITSDLPRKEDRTYVNDIRDWKIALNLDGSVENMAVNSYKLVDFETEEETVRDYPPRLRLPGKIKDRLSSRQEEIVRKELFALGGLAYHLISGKPLYDGLGDSADSLSVIQTRLAAGDFPDDVWGFSTAVRILGCWCPEFGKELVSARLEIEKSMC
jgi:hypothetical protein